MKEGFFLSIDDWCEHVQINLGPNVGDITIEYKPPRRGRIILMTITSIEAHEDMEDGTLWRRLNKKAQIPRAD